MQPLQICIGPIIRIGRESWCLPYAGFFGTNLKKFTSVFLFKNFLDKPNFSEIVLCHCEMLDWTMFALDIGVCIVHAVICFKKYLVSISTIIFFMIFEDPHNGKFLQC